MRRNPEKARVSIEIVQRAAASSRNNCRPGGAQFVRNLHLGFASRACECIRAETSLAKLKDRYLAILEAWNTQKVRWLFSASTVLERISEGPWPYFLKLKFLLLSVKCVLSAQRRLQLDNARLQRRVVVLETQTLAARIVKLPMHGGELGHKLPGAGHGLPDAVECGDGTVEKGGCRHPSVSHGLRSTEVSSAKGESHG